MDKIKAIEKRLGAIEKRNQKVEINKSWETSAFRKCLLILFTYLAIGFYMNAISVESPWLNAIIPAMGFLLSTLTLPIFKKWWIKNLYHKKDL